MIKPTEFEPNGEMRCPVMGGEVCMGDHCALAVKYDAINYEHGTYAHWRCGLARFDDYDEPQIIGLNG